jgi:hypothetical protein
MRERSRQTHQSLDGFVAAMPQGLTTTRAALSPRGHLYGPRGSRRLSSLSLDEFLDYLFERRHSSTRASA